MSHTVKIAGREIVLTWTNEVAKRFFFRLASIGGMPRQKDFTNPASAAASVAKVVWALLPKADLSRYESPEDLFVDIGDDEAAGVAEAVAAIFSEMAPDPEKKSSSRK